MTTRLTNIAEIIPKFINLLQRNKPLYIHGNGHNTRRFLYAGDAADAFDTILHRGEIGQIYNVDSRDEISNLNLAHKLLGMFNVSDVKGSIQHTKDRPFNDRRYAVDGSKLRRLGWQPRVSFEEGLANTVDWYGKFSSWWGAIDGILSPFPEVTKYEESSEVEETRVGSKSSEDGLQADVGAKTKIGSIDAIVANAQPDHGVNGVGTKKRKAEAMASE